MKIINEQVIKGDLARLNNNYFVFVDESGNNEQEDLFALGVLFVPANKIGAYYESLHKVKSKIVTKVKLKEKELEQTLSQEDLLNFYKGRRREYELKFKNINQTVAEEYTWLISQYFKFSDVRFTCLVIDKSKYPDPDGMSFYDVYMTQLEMLLRNTIKDGENIVLLPDDITITGDHKYKIYEDDINGRMLKRNKNIVGTHRVESHSDIFVQMTDVLTGAVLFEFKKATNKHKRRIVEKVKEKLNVSNLAGRFTKEAPNYFSVWPYERRSKQ